MQDRPARRMEDAVRHGHRGPSPHSADGDDNAHCLSLQTFRFTTRLQRLNSIEASSRAKLTFLEQLYRFHSSQGNSSIAVPTVNHKRLDLWLLRKEVQKLGGYEAVRYVRLSSCHCRLTNLREQVSKNKKWAELGQLMGYQSIPGLASQLKNSYMKIILPFENYSDHVRSAPIPEATNPLSAETNGSAEAPAAPTGDSGSAPPSPLSQLSDLGEDVEMLDSTASGAKSSRPRRRMMGA